MRGFLLYYRRTRLTRLSTAHESAIHTARLRVELSQSKAEQRDYLKNVELARVLDKRRKQKGDLPEPPKKEQKRRAEGEDDTTRKKARKEEGNGGQLDSVLSSVF